MVCVVSQDPAHHAHGQGGVCTRGYRDPLIGLCGRVVEARINGHVLAAVALELHQIPSHTDHRKIGLEGVGAKEDDVFGTEGVWLPAFGPPSPHAVLAPRGIPGDELVGHMSGRLADRGVAQAVVCGAPAVLPDPLAHLLLDAAARGKTEEVTLLSELRDGFVDERVWVGDQLPNPGSDLGEGLIPADRLPAAGVSRPHSLQRMLDPEGIVERLYSGLAFQAQPAELGESFFWRGPVGDPVRVVVFVHIAVVGVIGVAIQFDQYPFLDLGTDAAP